MNYAKQVLIEADQSNERSWRYLKHYMSTAKMFGVSKQAVKDDYNTYAYNATTSASNPTARWTWGILIHSPWDSTAALTQIFYRLKIQITYYCLLTQQNLDVPII